MKQAASHCWGQGSVPNIFMWERFPDKIAMWQVSVRMHCVSPVIITVYAYSFTITDGTCALSSKWVVKQCTKSVIQHRDVKKEAEVPVHEFSNAEIEVDLFLIVYFLHHVVQSQLHNETTFVHLAVCSN
jgi:hypothetical protein